MDGKIEIDPMITHTMPLDDINDAFDLMHKGEFDPQRDQLLDRRGGLAYAGYGRTSEPPVLHQVDPVRPVAPVGHGYLLENEQLCQIVAREPTLYA